MRRPQLLAFLASASLACGFFTELEGTEADTDGDTEGMEADTDGCTVLEDDRCLDQDLLNSCDPVTAVTSMYNCAVLCGSAVNFTCTATATGQHACWCVTPGTYKIDSCTQLETCLASCGTDATGACGETCFGRTTSETVRLYGSLVSCAALTCEETCYADPASCEPCVSQAKAGLFGDCGVHRSVCDADKNDDEPWP